MDAVMEMQQLVDLCGEQFARPGKDERIRSLCAEAHDELDDYDEIDLLGNLMALGLADE